MGLFCVTPTRAAPARRLPVPGDDDAVTTFTQEEVDAKIAEANKGLEANRDEVLGELKTLRDASKAFDGIDPEKHKALLAAEAEAAKKKAEDEGDWAARETQLKELHATETSALKTELGSAHGSIEKLLVDAQAVAAIADAKGSAKVLLPHVKQLVRVVEKDGQHSVQVVNEKGEQRFSDSQGTPMTIMGLVDELRQDPDFARNFEGSGSSGGGSSKSNGGAGGGSNTVIDRGDFSKNLEGIIKGDVQVEGFVDSP